MRTAVPPDLAERLFRALYRDFDLLMVGGLYIAVPADGTTPLAFSGSTLAEVALQISSETERETDMPDPFAVDEESALDTLMFAWGDRYQIRVTGGVWQAWHCDDPPEAMFTASVPDELVKLIRNDFTRREGQ